MKSYRITWIKKTLVRFGSGNRPFAVPSKLYRSVAAFAIACQKPRELPYPPSSPGVGRRGVCHNRVTNTAAIIPVSDFRSRHYNIKHGKYTHRHTCRARVYTAERMNTVFRNPLQRYDRENLDPRRGTGITAFSTANRWSPSV